MKEACHTYEYVCQTWETCLHMHAGMSHVIHMNEAWHTYEGDVPHK